MSAAIKMDELLVSWLASDNVYENVLNLIETYRTTTPPSPPTSPKRTATGASASQELEPKDNDALTTDSPRMVVIPPFYCPPGSLNEDGSQAPTLRARHSKAHPTIFLADQSWEGIFMEGARGGGGTPTSSTEPGTGGETVPPPPPNPPSAASSLDGTVSGTHASGTGTSPGAGAATHLSIRDQVFSIVQELGKQRNGSAIEEHAVYLDGTSSGGESQEYASSVYLALDDFVKVTKELCHFPSFFNGPFYKRILYLHHLKKKKATQQNDTQDSEQEELKDLELYTALETNALSVGILENEDGSGDNQTSSSSFPNFETCISLSMLKEFWKDEMEHYDLSERFFRLLKQPHEQHVGKNEFNPYIKELLKDHPVRYGFVLYMVSTVYCLFRCVELS